MLDDIADGLTEALAAKEGTRFLGFWKAARVVASSLVGTTRGDTAIRAHFGGENEVHQRANDL